MTNTKQPQKTFDISKKVSLAIRQENPHLEFIPEAENFYDHQNMVEQIGIAINKRLPILLMGETGTGKTSLVRYLASKTNNCFRRVNHSGGTTVDDIKGKILINKNGTYWVDGVLVEALKNGYWYLADEINVASPEINFVYHSLLDDDAFIVLEENGGEIIRPHKYFRFFASMNPPTDYAGTKELNRALMSRFIVVKADFPSPEIEAKILVERTKIAKIKAEKMVQFAKEIRNNYAKGQIDFVLSTRDLIYWATMYNEQGAFVPSAEVAIINKVENNDYNSVKDLMLLHFNHLDTPGADRIKQAGDFKVVKTWLKPGDKLVVSYEKNRIEFDVCALDSSGNGLGLLVTEDDIDTLRNIEGELDISDGMYVFGRGDVDNNEYLDKLIVRGKTYFLTLDVINTDFGHGYAGETIDFFNELVENAEVQMTIIGKGENGK